MAKGQENLKSLNEGDLRELAENLRDGMPIATPVFDGATRTEIKQMLAFGRPARRTGRQCCTTAAPANGSTAP